MNNIISSEADDLSTEDTCPTGVCPIHRKAWNISLTVIGLLAVATIGLVVFAAYSGK